jgi:hypothetical protein
LQVLHTDSKYNKDKILKYLICEHYLLSPLNSLIFCFLNVLILSVSRLHKLSKLPYTTINFTVISVLQSSVTRRGGSLSFLVGTISNVLVMEIGWTDVGSRGYILVSCAHSNASFCYSRGTSESSTYGNNVFSSRFIGTGYDYPDLSGSSNNNEKLGLPERLSTGIQGFLIENKIK